MARLTTGQAYSRAAQFHPERAKQLRRLNGARLTAGQARNRAAARFRLEQVRQLRHLSGARRMAGQASSRAARCRLQARLRAKRTAREKEGKWLMVSLASRHKEVERLPLAGHHKEVARPLQPNAARDSHNTERSNQKKERLCPGHNKSNAIVVAAPEIKIPEPLSLSRQEAIEKRTALGLEFRLQAVLLGEPRKRGTPNVEPISFFNSLMGVTRPIRPMGLIRTTQRSGPRLGLRL